ncbi:MAG: hypothetical protein ACRCTE_13520 [Cellulosilyticaceae bacterium]
MESMRNKTMYCVLGDKVLRCDVKKKLEGFSLCRVGTAQKEQRVPNECVFQNEGAAREFLKQKRRNKSQEQVQVSSAMDKCNEIYQRLLEETGIDVRLIDRQWTVSAAHKHAVSLKKTMGNKPELHDKKVSKAFQVAPPKKQSASPKYHPGNKNKR